MTWEHIFQAFYISFSDSYFYYEETFAPVARLEAIRILLDFSVAKGFKLYL
jgi:hypothetical protein